MGQLILPDSGVIYIDTSVVIYSVEWNPDYYSLLEPLWLKLQAREIEVVSSERYINGGFSSSFEKQ